MKLAQTGQFLSSFASRVATLPFNRRARRPDTGTAVQGYSTHGSRWGIADGLALSRPSAYSSGTIDYELVGEPALSDAEDSTTGCYTDDHWNGDGRTSRLTEGVRVELQSETSDHCSPIAWSGTRQIFTRLPFLLNALRPTRSAQAFVRTLSVFKTHLTET